MSLLLLLQKAAATVKTGSLTPGAQLRGADATTYARAGSLVAGTSLSGSRNAAPAVVSTPLVRLPSVTYQVAFASQPLAASPSWNDLSDRLRAFSLRRGRSYEFDRMETGTTNAALANRDAALNPGNTSSVYNPVRSTRPVRVFIQWQSAYAAFRGITEGFPQTYRAQGKDAQVQINANDLFYALNQARFTPGSTTLGAAMALATDGSSPGASETITVASTDAPLPQVVPFDITIEDGLPTEETVTVTAIVSPTSWTVTRSSTPFEHAPGSAVTTTAVSFPPALSGERIRQVLEAVGFDSQWYDLDAGQSMIAASEDVSQVNPLEHINLVTDAEFGRFFVSKEGLFTFRDRHSIILDYQTATITFHEPATGSEIPFNLDGELSHSEEKLYNRVRITVKGGPYAGAVVDVKDQSSIDNHFERIFEREFPYANLNDAEAAAQYVLLRYAESQIRLPGISVRAALNPSILWPLLLAREIGERVRFRYQPEAGGSEIDKQMSIDGIAHQIAPGDHVVTFQCTEVDSTQYWILGQAGSSELESTTRVGF